MRVIILAAGEATRWNWHMGTAKHLLPIGGEPLLHRTVRLLLELQPGLDVRIAARPEDREAYAVDGATTFAANLCPARFDADKFLSSADHWSNEGDTVLLYGDCYFSREALATILATRPADWLLFARFKPSTITGSEWPECWAFRIARGFRSTFVEVGLWLIREYEQRRLQRIGGWEFYAALTSGDLCAPGVRAGNSVEIDDWTEDFDRPEDFSRWAERRVLQGPTA